ncbi:MAG: DUF4097 family beta strand repeat-containing protein [Thermoanaerobaculia bacterium]|nr:DUF4097 family beta strand repeat-containing protein [Thermoanaerobaculia bacterium]
MKRTLIASVLAVLVAAPALGWGDDCDHTAERDARIDAEGAGRLVVEARAGSLTLVGRPDADAVVARGTACSSRRSTLDDIQLTTRRRGDTLVLEVRIPDDAGWRSGSARLDLDVEVPAGLHVVVDDTSGSVEIEGVASLEIEDGSGSIEVTRVAGRVQIRDGSGEIDLRDAGGPVDIRDGSGSITVADIGGDVELTDGSGSIDVRDVRGSVRVRSDGSGSIRVVRVDGDFVVESDGSGGVSFDRIAGRVSVP